jgi:hypothetical protein
LYAKFLAVKGNLFAIKEEEFKGLATYIEYNTYRPD